MDPMMVSKATEIYEFIVHRLEIHTGFRVIELAGAKHAGLLVNESHQAMPTIVLDGTLAPGFNLDILLQVIGRIYCHSYGYGRGSDADQEEREANAFGATIMSRYGLSHAAHEEFLSDWARSVPTYPDTVKVVGTGVDRFWQEFGRLPLEE